MGLFSVLTLIQKMDTRAPQWKRTKNVAQKVRPKILQYCA